MAASQRIERGLGVEDAPRARSLVTPRLVGAGLAAWVVLFGAVHVGLSTPDRELLSGASGGVALDYSALRGTIAQLTEAFVAQVLGLAPPPQDEPADVPSVPSALTTEPVSAASEPQVPGGARVEVTHPPDNDEFEDAYEVSSVPFAANTDASPASRQSGEPASCSATGPTLWYRYPADRTVGLSAQSIASGPVAALGVYVGDDLGGLEPVGCDTSASGPAVVRFTAKSGETYWFQVAAPLGAERVRFGLDLLGTTTRMPGQSDQTFADASCGPVEVSPYPGPIPPINPALSDDGRYVVFASYWSETFTYHCPTYLVPLGSDEYLDVFVHDRRTGVTEMVSVSSDGELGNERSGQERASISADGRYVTFWSNASNLVPDDTNGTWDVFVRDRVAGLTTRVSVSSDGTEGLPPPVDPWYDQWRLCEPSGGRDGSPVRDRCYLRRYADMTPDGRYVVFSTDLVGLVDDGDAPRDRYAVYRHDRVTGETIKVSLLEQVGAGAPTISADGSKVAYGAIPEQFQPLPDGDDDLLLPGREDYPPPVPGRFDGQVFVRDLATGETTLVTRGVDGQPGSASSQPIISNDGRHVVFSSDASNLVPDDRNGIPDVFVYDLTTGRIELVSVNSAEAQQTADEQVSANRFPPGFGQVNPDHFASVSGDGRYVAFHSTASNLDSDADRGTDSSDDAQCEVGSDVFLRDRVAGTTLLVSVSSRGEPGNRCSRYPYISADGGTIAFISAADNLVAGDENGPWGDDLFFHQFAVLP